MADEPMTYLVEADGKSVGSTADRGLALMVMGKWACRGAEVELRSGRTGRLLSWGELPCTCGLHAGRPTVMQPA